ncbi:uncharacterized protein G2W53_003831 [Senna tora]|uniref:Uncharacterized protein n=1 Tax=Senna tora TaxID=362788 RepID=A0A834XBW8_9FABA|nr:uncharacterized protein G2W53_003831 [Senna tora]
MSSLDESELTVQEWADSNDVSEEPWEYDRVSKASSISEWDSKSPSSLEVTSGLAFWMALKNSAVDPKSRLKRSHSSTCTLRFSICLLVSARSSMIASFMALNPWMSIPFSYARSFARGRQGLGFEAFIVATLL